MAHSLEYDLWSMSDSNRYHDTTLAFITAHYAADCRGRSYLPQRNMDASRTLRELCLVDTNEDFDTHLQHDHCVRRLSAILEVVWCCCVVAKFGFVPEPVGMAFFSHDRLYWVILIIASRGWSLMRCYARSQKRES